MTVVPPGPSCSLPLKASMAAHFIVIGGGLTGLSAAYALARSGHQVTVLEKDNFDFASDGGVCRMSPNMSKIFFRWGLEDRLRRIAIQSKVTTFSRYEEGEILGEHKWDDEYIFETGGDFIFARNSNLREFVYQLAVQSGVTIFANTEAKSIDVYDKTVTLVNGEVISADAFIGADGLHGISRPAVLEGKPDKPAPVGLVMYNGIVRGEDVRSDAELAVAWASLNLFVACGNSRAAMAFPLGGPQKDYAIQVYVPDNGVKSPPTLQEFQDAVGKMQPKMRKCVDRATRITRTPVEDRPDIEDWVHDEGPLLLIGEAAHPCPPGAIQTCGLALEDAGVLGKLFSHLSNPEQIQSFLYAFQDLREKRCSDIRKAEINIVHLITIPDGDHQQARDSMMTANYAQGRSVFYGDEGSMAEQWEVNKITFTYDPEDDADAWWLQWGMLRERAKQSSLNLSPTKPLPVGIAV